MKNTLIAESYSFLKDFNKKSTNKGRYRLTYQPLEDAYYFMQDNSPFFLTMEFMKYISVYKEDKHCILLAPIKNNVNIALHNHDYFEFIYAYKGKLKHEIDGKSFVMEEGDICIINKRANHSIQSSKEENIIYIGAISETFRHELIEILPEEHELQNFYNQGVGKKNYRNFPTGQFKIVRDKANLMVEEYMLNQSGVELAVKALFLLLNKELMHISDMTRSMEVDRKKTNDMSEIIEFISTNYRDVTIDYVANHFHFHPNYLSRLIKKETGKNFSSILQETRLQKAKTFIEYTDKNIEEIAYEVGYKSVSHFHRVFKAKENITPLGYKQSLGRAI